MPSAISWMLVPDSRFVIIEELLRALRRECNERAGRYRESSGQSSVAKCAEANLALACREECRPQAEEVAEHIVMIAGHFEAPGMARPRLPVEAVVHRYDVAIVGDTQVELFACHGRPDPALLAAVGVREHLAAVEAESAVRALAIEKEQSAARTRGGLERHFHLVGVIAAIEHERRAILGPLAFAGDRQSLALVAGALEFVRTGLVEAPLDTEPVDREVVRQRTAALPGFAAARLRDRFREVAAAREKPSIVRPLDRFQQSLPAKRAVAIFVAVIDHPPVATGAFREARVATRPPALVGVARADDGIVRALLPGSMHGSRTRRHHHVARRRA